MMTKEETQAYYNEQLEKHLAMAEAQKKINDIHDARMHSNPLWPPMYRIDASELTQPVHDGPTDQ